MKTIRQIADEIGVSKTAVRKKLTLENRNMFAESIGNTLYINERGEEYIKSHIMNINANHVRAVTENQTETVSELVSILKNELLIKNKQIDDLNARLADTAAALVVAQQTAATAQALHAGTIQNQLINSTGESSDEEDTRANENIEIPSKKRGIFGMFGRKENKA